MSSTQIDACIDDEETVQFPIHLLTPSSFQQDLDAPSIISVNADSANNNYSYNQPEHQEIAQFPSFLLSSDMAEGESSIRDSSADYSQYISSQQTVEDIPSRRDQYARSLIIELSAISFNYLCNLFYSSLYIVKTPSSLYNVPVNKSRLRSNGINILSIDYSSSIPNPRHVLQKNEELIVFGRKAAAENYFVRNGESTNLISVFSSSSTARFDQFAKKLMNYHIAIVPVPHCLIGSTLVETPQFARFGILIISINFQIHHPAKICNKVFEPNDMLLCCFSKSNDKQQTLMNVFSNISNFSGFI